MTPEASAFQLKKAASICNRGGIISYPTESVFGLGCNPNYFPAVEKILLLKQRPISKGLILIAPNIEQLLPYIIAADRELKKITAETSTPTTWLVNASKLTPDWITGQHKKIAVRITQHPIAKRLCEQLAYPLVSTSANVSGKTPARSSLTSRLYFNQQVDFYIGGKTGSLPHVSNIIDLESGDIIRGQ